MEKDLKKEIRRVSGTNSFMAFIFLVLSYIEFVGIEIFCRIFDYDYGLPIVSLVAYTFQYALNVPLLVFLYRKSKAGREAPPLKTAFCKPQASFWEIFRWLIIGAGLAYAVTLASNIFFEIIQNIFRSDFDERTLDISDVPMSNISIIIPTSFYAPFFEEIFFRGTMVRNANRYSTWSQIIITGILFGLWHTNYTQIIMAAVLGTWFGFLTVKTKSIFPSMILHFVLNSISATASILIYDMDLENIDYSYIFEHMGQFMFLIIFEFTSIGLMAAAFVLLIIEIAVYGKKTFKLECPENTLPESKKALIYLSSPMTIFVIISFIVITVLSAAGIA